MIALEISLNGKRVCTAGAEDLSVLAAIVGAGGRLGKKTVPPPTVPHAIYCDIGGLTSRADPAKNVHLHWQSLKPLKVGDTIQIRILETTHVDRPKSRTKAERRNA